MDGTLGLREERGIRRHVDRCGRCSAKVDDLRAAVRWLGTVSEEGESCLSVEGMAAVLEGKLAGDHVETCPRCAAEFSALKAAARPVTSRIYRRRVPAAAWGVAASLAAAAAVLLLVLPLSLPPEPEPIVAGTPQARPVPSPIGPSAPVLDAPLPPMRPIPPVRPEPDPERPEAAPRPAKPPRPAAPDVRMPERRVARKEPAPPRPTVSGPLVPATVAVDVRSGGLSALTGDRWKKTRTVTEGRPLRADGRTRLDFARTRLTIESSSKFTLTRNQLSLTEGRISAEVHEGSPFALTLAGHRIVPQASIGRVLLSARPDRVVIDEGFAVSNEIVLHEGVEHHIRRGRLEPQRRRTLPGAARPREVVVWTLELDRIRRGDRRITAGSVGKHPEGYVLESGASKVPDHSASQIAYLSPDPAKGFVTVGEGTAIRFRYFLVRPARLHFVMWNLTKGENFERWIDAVHGRWTTVTLFFRDIPANPGGRKVVCEVGDRYRTITWNVGRPRDPAQLLIKGLEIVEVERW